MSTALGVAVVLLAAVVMVVGVTLFYWMQWIEERLEALEKKP